MENPVIAIVAVAVVAAVGAVIWRLSQRSPSNQPDEAVRPDQTGVPPEDQARHEPEPAPEPPVAAAKTADRPPSVPVGSTPYVQEDPKSGGDDPKYGDGDPTSPDDEITRIIQDIRDRTFFWTNIDANFRPLDAQPEELTARGLQPLPDEHDPRQQEKLAFWKRMYGPPLEWVQAEYLELVPEQIRRTAEFRIVSAPSLHESSRNWSGLYISPRDGRMIVEVRGEWNVPTVNFPTGATTALTERRSSTWIGLDGQRRYFDSSLPQVGTEQFIFNTSGTITRPLYLFIQWFLREAPQLPMYLPLPFIAGHNIMAAITAISPTEVIFTIKNQSTGAFLTPIKVTSPSGPMPSGPSPMQVRVSGATAEWVMERPMVWGSDDLYELPSFNTIHFVGCGASSAIAYGGLGQDETLYGARRINMKRLESMPPLLRTLVTSEPHSIVWPPREQEAHSFDVDFRP